MLDPDAVAQASIVLRRHSGNLELEVRDAGVGLSPSALKAIEAGHPLGLGTRLQFRIPGLDWAEFQFLQAMSLDKTYPAGRLGCTSRPSRIRLVLAMSPMSRRKGKGRYRMRVGAARICSPLASTGF